MPDISKRRSPHTSDIKSRLSAIETDYSSMHEDLTELKSDFQKLQGAMTMGLTEIRKEISGMNKVNWTPLISFAALAVSVGALILSNLIKPIEVSNSFFERRLMKTEEVADKSWETTLRHEEQIKTLQEKKP